jgi:hypothetical protein
MSLNTKPYTVLWMSIIFVAGFSLLQFELITGYDILNFYFFISYFNLGIIFLVALIILGLIYYVNRNNKLIKWLTALHLMLSISSIFVLISIDFFFDNLWFQSEREIVRKVKNITFLTLFISQLILAINLVISSSRNTKV